MVCDLHGGAPARNGTIGWLVSMLLRALHRYHPFPDEMFKFATEIELYLVYADTALTGAVLLVGMVRFYRQVMKEER